MGRVHYNHIAVGSDQRLEIYVARDRDWIFGHHVADRLLPIGFKTKVAMPTAGLPAKPSIVDAQRRPLLGMPVA